MAKILVVDDSKFMRLTLKQMLEKDGAHTVVGEAENDIEAILKYKEFKPDLATIDIIMPVEGGIHAVKEIIKFDRNAKIIMVSAMGQEKIVKEAIDLGAKGFIVKPIESEKLLETIAEILK